MFSYPILVLAEHQSAGDGAWSLTPAAAQVISLARTLTTSGVEVAVVDPGVDTDALASLGVARIVRPALGDASPRVSAVVADALSACLASDTYAAVLMPSSYRGREVAARLAMRENCAAVADATALRFEGDVLHATTVALAGAWTNTIRICADLPIVTIKPGAYDVTPAELPSTPEVLDVSVELSAQAQAVSLVSSTVQAGTGRVPLTDADTVVVAGRGVGEDMALVEALADELGAAIGATRVVADEGWAPRHLQIGQTGANIAPNLYIGLGVSGAIHHTVGMQSSAHIVAVCDDPDAPIFEMADFGVVGDLFDVVPQALDALRAARS